MKLTQSIIALGIMLAPLANAQTQNLRIELNPTGRNSRIRSGVPAASPQSQDLQPPILYHGGGVLKGDVNLYLIWYGNHTASTKSLLTSFLSGLSGSPYLNINSTYPESDGRLSASAVTVRGSAQDNYSLGRSLADADILTIIGSAIAHNHWSPDQTGIYFVFTASDVQLPGFGSSFCGWHNNGRVSGTPVRFAFIGDATRYGSACSAQPTVSPNSNPPADAMANVLAHELMETITDPNLDAWYDDRGNESADKCAWTFGSVFPVANGSYANMMVGANYFLIQEIWLNSGAGRCTLSY